MLSNRRQTRNKVFKAVDLCHKYTITSSMDLIYGWPGQTVEKMLDDLRDGICSGVNHLTHDDLNVAGRSDFASPQKRALLQITDSKHSPGGNPDCKKVNCQ